MKRKNVDSQIGLWVAIIASFSLAILDMMFLRTALVQLTEGLQMSLDMISASVASFSLAIVANVAALMWGAANGRAMAKKAINKESRSWFISWVILGIIYALIRGAVIYIDMSNPETDHSAQAIFGQLIIVIILAVSYIGSGTAIEWAARQIWDADVKEYRQAKVKFEEIHKDISLKSAAIQEVINTLKDFDQNYKSLDKQYEKIKIAIMQGEKSVMAEIVGKTEQQNPTINPVKANDVMEEVLRMREKENEKLHQEQE